MGIVYKAFDLQGDREVALKVIRPEARSPKLDAAFKREARLASSLNHPGLIKVLDIVTDGDPAYIVMEYAGGDPLNRLIPSGGFPADRAVAHDDAKKDKSIKVEKTTAATRPDADLLDFLASYADAADGLDPLGLADADAAPAPTAIPPSTRSAFRRRAKASIRIS